MDTTHNIEQFEELMSKVKRPGMDKLMDFIRSSDFYEAPASTRYHLSEPGGLLQHSLNVYYALSAKRYSPLWGPLLRDIPEESLILCALCHDFAKIDFYKKCTRNQKSYSPEVVATAPKKDVKKDGKGEYVWQSVDSYEIDEKLPYGHGEKSVYILQQLGVPLLTHEALAVRFHMGYSEEKSLYNALGKAIEMHPFVLALHEADGESAKIIESGNYPYMNEECNLEPLFYAERLTKLLANSPINGVEALVDDFLTMLENPVEKTRNPNIDDDCPFD